MYLTNTIRNTAKTGHRNIHCKNRHGGFTLIELMVVVAIIAVLVALAMPSYRDYIMRARITEGMKILSSVKIAVVEHYAESSRMPLYLEDIGWPSRNSPSPGTSNSFRRAFGFKSDLWSRVGLVGSNRKKKSQYVDIFLRTRRLSELDNTRGFLYIQAKSTPSGSVQFRCSVTKELMMKLVPAACSRLRSNLGRW